MYMTCRKSYAEEKKNIYYECKPMDKADARGEQHRITAKQLIHGIQLNKLASCLLLSSLKLEFRSRFLTNARGPA